MVRFTCKMRGSTTVYAMWYNQDAADAALLFA
jgi:hypothetical protein